MKTLNANGARIPALGLGTWQLRGEVARTNVREALAAGYRHVDTARMYENEAEVGQGISESGVPRDEVFLTTKIWPSEFAAGALAAATEDSLRTLGTDHVDLLLLHWPSREVPLSETIPALNRLRERGLTRHIGVSNFNIALVEEARALSQAPLAVDQVEFHPFLDQSKLLAHLRHCGMCLTAYCPIAKGEVVGASVLREIAEKHGVDAVQVTLAWHLSQEGVAAIPRSSKLERIVAALRATEITLSADEIAAINALARPDGRMVQMPALAPEWD